MEKEITRRHGDKKKKGKKHEKIQWNCDSGISIRVTISALFWKIRNRGSSPLLFVCVSRKLFTKSVPTSPDDTLLHNSCVKRIS